MALIVVITGCASPHQQVNVVANTLQSFRAGQTTFKEFKADSGLLAEIFPQTPSYLDSSPGLQSKTQTIYAFPKGSPWKLYETGRNKSWLNGNFSESMKFVVGDHDHPISILTFDDHGQLITIAPVPSAPR
jgi:hypothetical protein